jgi:hypothetical protein
MEEIYKEVEDDDGQGEIQQQDYPIQKSEYII